MTNEPKHLILSEDEAATVEAALTKFAEGIDIIASHQNPISRVKMLQVLTSHNNSRSRNGALAYYVHDTDADLRPVYHDSQASALQAKQDAEVYDLYRDGHTVTEIAHLLGIYKNAVDVRLARAQKRMQADRTQAAIARKAFDDRMTGQTGTPLATLNLTARSLNALLREGITTVEALLALPAEDLADIRNLGTKSRDEIATAIATLRGTV